MVDKNAHKHFTMKEPTILPPSDFNVSFNQADYDALLDQEHGTAEYPRFSFDGNDAVLTWINKSMEPYRLQDWGSESNDYWYAHLIYYHVYVDDNLVFSGTGHCAPLKNLPIGDPITVQVVPEIVINAQTNERYYGEAAEYSVTVPEGKIGQPIRIIEGHGYDPFYGADMNSVGGVELRWSGKNNTGKTINYYTAHLTYTNAVGDPAFDKVTGESEESIRCVGPVWRPDTARHRHI